MILPGIAPDPREAMLDRRLFAESGDEAARDLVYLRPDDCLLAVPGAGFHPAPDQASCHDLVARIAADGGNIDPVLVRRRSGNTMPPYELVLGQRRHFAIGWLNHNGRPELRLLARVVEIDDETAFRLADIENRDRPDICELARAYAYQWALAHFYGGVQSRMAEALDISNSHLSRLLGLAELPAEVIAAFACKEDIKVRHSEVLTPLLRRAEALPKIVEEAAIIDREQQALAAAGERLHSAASVLARLKDAATRRVAASRERAALFCDGALIGTVRMAGGKVEVAASVAPDCDPAAVAEAIREGLSALLAAQAAEK